MEVPARVPAWRRLGLQLKRPASTLSPESTQTARSESTNKKLKVEAKKQNLSSDFEQVHSSLGREIPGRAAESSHTASPSPAEAGYKAKRARANKGANLRGAAASATATKRAPVQSQVDASASAVTSSKSVTFADDAKQADGPLEGLDTSEADAVDEEAALAKRRELKGQKKEEKQRRKAERLERDGPDSLSIAKYLVYLDDFQNKKDAWKFNKTYQSQILRDLFNFYRIPESYHLPLVSYIAGLQGEAARARVEEAAQQVLSETEDIDASTNDFATEAPASKLNGHSSSDMETREARKEAFMSALRADLKKMKAIHKEAVEAKEQTTTEGKLKLLKRIRATRLLQAMGRAAENQPQRTAPESGPEEDPRTLDSSADAKGKRRRGTRGKKRRTGVPDDDDDDDSDGDEDLLEALSDQPGHASGSKFSAGASAATGTRARGGDAGEDVDDDEGRGSTTDASEDGSGTEDSGDTSDDSESDAEVVADK